MDWTWWTETSKLCSMIFTQKSEVSLCSTPIRVPNGYGTDGNTWPRCPLPLQWHDPLSLVQEGRSEWGDHGQSPMESALQAGPGVQLMSWLAIHNGWHSLLPWLAGVSPTWGEKSQWISFICIITRGNRTISAGDPNKGVNTEWSTLGCPTGNIPACHYSPEGGSAQKASPATPHTPSPSLLQYSTGWPPDTFEDEVQSCIWKQLTILKVNAR